MFTLRVVTGGDRLSSRDTRHETKRDCLGAIEKLGELHMIRRFGKLYVVMPKR